MKKVALLQKYLSPYRVPLFNEITHHPEIDLTLVYYGRLEKRRKWSTYPYKDFHERQVRGLFIPLCYEANIELPISLYLDLKKIKPDIIICAADMGGIFTYLYTRMGGLDYIIWSESTPTTEKNLNPLKIRLRKIIYTNARNFIVPGKFSEEYIKTYVPFPKVFYANNSIKEEDFMVSRERIIEKFSNEKLTITFSGSLIDRKGIIPLLSAFRLLMKQNPSLRENCILKIMGTGPLDLSQYADSNIVFEGFCEGEAYSTNFRNSHLFILPSISDSNPLTVIEALFSGNVLIVSDGVGNYPEAVGDGSSGLVLKGSSADEIVRGLKAILSLPREKLTKMALNSLAASEQFTTERSAQGFIAAILDREAALNR